MLAAAVALTVIVLPPHVLGAAAEEEFAILLTSLAIMLAINLYLLRRAFGPLEGLAALGAQVDPTPGQRVPVRTASPR